MRVILSGRKTSRTTQLIELCYEAEQRGEPSYIVCHSTIACMHTFRRGQEMDKMISMPITHTQFLDGPVGYGAAVNFFIDDADQLLQMLAQGRIAAVTMLKEDEDV